MSNEADISNYSQDPGRMMNYQDSGFSEEDPDHHVTTCLMKTPSGSIYIQPTSKHLSKTSYNLQTMTEPGHCTRSAVTLSVNVTPVLSIFIVLGTSCPSAGCCSAIENNLISN